MKTHFQRDTINKSYIYRFHLSTKLEIAFNGSSSGYEIMTTNALHLFQYFTRITLSFLTHDPCADKVPVLRGKWREFTRIAVQLTRPFKGTDLAFTLGQKD